MKLHYCLLPFCFPVVAINAFTFPTRFTQQRTNHMIRSIGRASLRPRFSSNIAFRKIRATLDHNNNGLNDDNETSNSKRGIILFSSFRSSLMRILQNCIIRCTGSYYDTIRQFNYNKQPWYNKIPRGGADDNSNNTNSTVTNSSELRNQHANKQMSRKLRLYLTCSAIVLLWISTGTIFYSYYNKWPLPQSFFYAVDAGMSIGFCTEVAETRIGSKAFTIIFILLGASCVGGALALFIQDIMEGVDGMRNGKFEMLLVRDILHRADVDGTERLSYVEFRKLVEEWKASALCKNFDGDNDYDNDPLTEEGFSRLCNEFDPMGKGIIEFQVFLKRYKDIDAIISTSSPLHSKQWHVRKMFQFQNKMKALWTRGTRLFFFFILWITMGICYGRYDQGWDWITSTHFAVSALATGGLTAPSVNSDGILPTKPAIFCGVYCMIGIPLMALTFSHFTRVLVEGHVLNEEENSIKRPIDQSEFELAKHLCTTDSVVHLSDFIVLQLLRQGKVSTPMINLIKAQFQKLDVNNSGVLTMDEATRQLSNQAKNSATENGV